MEIVAFGVQADERPFLEKAFAGRHQVRSLDVFLNRDTAPIAHGYEIVSSSVNADLGADVLQTLAAGGTKLIAQRSTGFNNIDLEAAADLGMSIGRVSFYSPTRSPNSPGPSRWPSTGGSSGPPTAPAISTSGWTA